MTANRDFKRLVRARMQKTGESYTAARVHFLAKKPTPPPAAPNYAKLAGMSDAAVKAATGCNWERWVWALDRVQAHTWPHRKIADYVHTKYKVRDWWTQTVTVGYERIKGLRDIGQRRGGGYETTKSKTFAVPVARLFGAFHDVRIRRRWLDGVALTVRSAAASKRMRLAWPDDTVVAINFIAKGAAKSQVAIQHGKLPDKSAATRMKTYWTARLAALGEVLTTP